MTNERESQVVAAFVSLTTTLADGFDVADLLTDLTSDCVRLLDVASAGLLLADGNGVMHLMAASSHATRELELFQLQRDEGPCLDCYRTGEPVIVPDLSQETKRWPQFTAAAAECGFASVHAVPMRLRDTVLGAMNLFGTRTGSLGIDDLALAQALAHVASVALVQDRATADKDVVVSQLNTALASRVVLEQAKGLLSQLGDLDMEQAFAVLRRYARDRNLRLSGVSADLVSRTLSAQLVLDHAAKKIKTSKHA